MSVRRYTYKDTAAVDGWPVAPFTNTTQLLQVPLPPTPLTTEVPERAVARTSVTVAVAADGSIYTVDVPTTSRGAAAAASPVVPVTTIGFDTTKYASVRLVVDTVGRLLVFHSAGVIVASCSGAATLSCKLISTAAYELGIVHDAVAAAGGDVYIGTDSGLVRFSGAGGKFSFVQTPKPGPVRSLAIGVGVGDSTGGMLATGNDQVVAIYTLDAGVNGPALQRWEWVTRLSDEAGGAYDGPAQAMQFHGDGSLYVATPTCVNIRSPNGSITRLDWRQGFPMNSTTSVSVEASTGNVLVGSAYGAAMWQR